MGVTLKAPEEHEAEMNIVNIKKIGGYYVTSNEFKKLVTHHV